MWLKSARIILRNRITILIVLAALSIFMGFLAFKAEITYEFANLLPAGDSTNINYRYFKKQFGQDGNILFVGMQEDGLYKLEKFNAWYELGNNIKKIEGVQEVVSIARLYRLAKNDSLKKFEFIPLLSQKPTTQTQVDSLRNLINKLPFYDKLIHNRESGSTVMAITFDKNNLNNKSRLQIVDEIKQQVDAFNASFPSSVHYSGLPYIRTVIARLIAHEMILFMVLAVLVTAIILFWFFRSLLPVLVSSLVVTISVLWSFGLTVLFNYKITVLSGLIPPLLIIIGVPNCILLLNKYHTEFAKYHNQARALTRMIEKIGISLLLANITTAIGFGVFCFVKSNLFFEFGLVASISVMLTYIFSMLLIPAFFSFLPGPSYKHIKHLEGKRLQKILEKITHLVHHKRSLIYAVTIAAIIISCIGIFKIKALGFVVDDLPEKDTVYVDLKYFEKNFNGVLPFEITVDTKKENGVFADNGRTLYKINNLYKLLSQYDVFSRPVSVIDAVKFSNQALHDDDVKYFRLPGAMDLTKISEYTSEAKKNTTAFNSFIDSAKQATRVSVQMADIGSVKVKQLVAELKPRIDSVFNFDKATGQWHSENEKYNITITGNSVMFLKGNDFLVNNLLDSVLLAVIIISIVLYTLFMSPGMILVSVLPSLIPLIITAGVMGYFNIYLKPSTILVFSIAFGIASDGTLYFLSKYRQEYRIHRNIKQSVLLSIKETGVSMIYTAIILACGFGIFIASDFGGTASLGILISFTLVTAYCSNLILLPAILLTLDKRISNKELLKQSILEEDDEDENANNNKAALKKETVSV